MTQALVDNDVLVKKSAYGLLLSLLRSKPYGADKFAMLGAAKYVVPKSLKRKLDAELLQAALREFEEATMFIVAIEPTREEIKLAAELEFAAQESNLELDGGESQLCAVLILRSQALLFTGDKRAIVAIGGLMVDGEHAMLRGNVVCLEQLFLWQLRTMDGALVRSAVCGKPPRIDMALSLCFGCYSGGSSLESALEGLGSHIGDLARKAPGVLIDADQFFKKTA